MQKALDLEAAQRRLHEQADELHATAKRACEQSAEETAQVMDWLHSEIEANVKNTKTTERVESVDADADQPVGRFCWWCERSLRTSA